MRVPIRSFRETVPLYVHILVYQYVISSTEPRAQAVSTAPAVQTSEIFGVAVLEVLHSLILHDESSFCNTGTRIPMSVDVKRCRYHAIRGFVVWTWYVSYEYGQYRTLHIVLVLLYSYRSTLASHDTWSYVSCNLLGVISTGT